MDFEMGARGAVAPPAARGERDRRVDAAIERGSPEQARFWAELEDGGGHVVLEARAGSGKSSSCRTGMHILLRRDPTLRIRYCCFNKSIAEEFAADCPPGVDVGTMHRFGLEALRSRSSVRIDESKTGRIVVGVCGGSGARPYLASAVKRLVSLAKGQGCLPGSTDPDVLSRLMDVHGIEARSDRDKIVGWTLRALEACADDVEVVDFDDMLWLPVVYGLDFKPVDYLFIDECQDLNPCQHEFARLASGSGRTVVVGDPYQAIYAWRGAATDSIDRLRESLRAKTLPLTVTWRCPASHVRAANRYVADLRAAPSAKEGRLERDAPDGADRAGTLVLCRSNAPLLSRCLRDVAALRPATMRGRAIGADLNRAYHDATYRDPPATRREAVTAVVRWENERIAALAGKDGVEARLEEVGDQAACLRAVAAAVDPSAVPSAIRDLFRDASPAGVVTYSSVHRAKGSEADRVRYLLSPPRRASSDRPWDAEQDRNLQYVALTRGREELLITDI